ncbi:MAG: class I SAM-dependent methyltransferase [Planctomycetia bacterium]|nr:class I SAM-dependent methyltransferase [Planctomycetia bacterium]
MNLLQLGIEAVERGWIPDVVTRAAVRRLCRRRLHDEMLAVRDPASSRRAKFVESLRTGPIAPSAEKANEQHYTLPPEFFSEVLGPHRKYSCCYYSRADAPLAEAEEEALAITAERAELADGQEILELGCGWGSLTLWAAARLPHSRITAVSNSPDQRRFIERLAAERGLRNVTIVTADMNDFAADRRFDRVVSVEMFEHMRNYDLLLERIAGWMQPTGKLFVHLFCHRELAYPFADEHDDDWMGRHFFGGGMMPAAATLTMFDRHLRVMRQHSWSGMHYQRTAEAWLTNLDMRRETVERILSQVYGRSEAARRLRRWRVFFLAVAELFGYAGGDEWFVSHYLLEHAG